jgi:hypothetical protein
MATVLDCIAGLAKSGKLSAIEADEAKALYRGLLDQGHTPDAVALALAEYIRSGAKTQRDHVEFCVNNPDKIPAVADAMREQWREARAGRRGH